MNQKGFATLEVILMVVVIGILATIAVPRFTDITTKANTAKVQADLATINSAAAIYEMEKGKTPTNIKTDLVDNNYLQSEPSAPTSGKIYIKTGTDSTTHDLTASSAYTIVSGEAVIDTNIKASDVGQKAST